MDQGLHDKVVGIAKDPAGIKDKLEAAGLGEARVIAELEKKLRAKVTKVFCSQGDVVYSDPLDDHAIQLRALENLIEMHGLKRQQVDVVVDDLEARLARQARVAEEMRERFKAEDEAS